MFSTETSNVSIKIRNDSAGSLLHLWGEGKGSVITVIAIFIQGHMSIVYKMAFFNSTELQKD